MVNLKDTCCLDINFDEKDNFVQFGEGVYPSLSQKVPLRQLLPSLLNKSLIYPEIVYEEYIQVFHESDRNILNQGVSFDLVTLPPGLLGIEFIKTHVYYSPANVDQKFSTVIEVHFGILTVIMQKNRPKDELDFEVSVEEGLVIKLAKGEKLAIPAGYYYTFINTEDYPVIFVRVYKQNATIDYSFLKRENGLAYYCIRKNARQEIVHNPLYREIPRIKELSPNTHIQSMGLDENIALYTQLRDKLDLFVDELWG